MNEIVKQLIQILCIIEQILKKLIADAKYVALPAIEGCFPQVWKGVAINTMLLSRLIAEKQNLLEKMKNEGVLPDKTMNSLLDNLEEFEMDSEWTPWDLYLDQYKNFQIEN